MTLLIPTKNWWETETYDVDAILPPQLTLPEYWGPKGPSLVRAYNNGSTQEGWGLGQRNKETQVFEPEFMPRYMRGEFLARRTEYGFNRGKHGAAIVTRGFRGMCVDIDGKNGGLEHAGSLGALPRTAAETSKSGNGYHLFFLTEEEWDLDEGFSLIPDQIGIVQGVDIRGVGCVYHYPQQRWNGVAPVMMPDYLRDQLLEKKQQRATRAATIASIATLDETEIIIMHDALLADLAKPIPAGKRNNTLFAIGQQLKNAAVPEWDDKVRTRAEELGLDVDEIEKLVSNIETYA